MPAPALAARKAVPIDPARTYVQARAAAMSGEHERSAALLAALAEASGGNLALTRKALGQAIGAGDMPLALSLAHKLPRARLPVDARLLLVADELRHRRSDRAIALLSTATGDDGEESDLSFASPLIEAWAAADRRDLATALRTIDAIPQNSLLGAFKAENRAFLLLRFRQVADAEVYARRAIGSAGGRDAHLRLAFADGFLAAGDRARAVAMVEGMGTEAGAARARVLAGKQSGQAVATGADAFAEMLLGLAIDLNRLNNKALPIGMVQVARYAHPDNSAAAVLLALLLDGSGRPSDALRVLQSVPAGDALAGQARDTAARILGDEKRFAEALNLARTAASAQGAGATDWARLGDVYQGMKRYNEAADAYGRAVALAQQRRSVSDIWPLYLLQATALEPANRWPEAKQALNAALAASPEQPLVLNFLGYAKLERGEDLDLAEAMIRKASALAPDDASITDSLGWALYKRGRLAPAIETLQRAAAADPQQAEIHEHLGDALYAAGRRYEARFAWSAALVVAEDDTRPRIQTKIDGGLSAATAAP